MQAGSIARTEGEIIATKAANDQTAHLSAEDRSRAKADWEKAHPGGKATEQDVSGQAWQNSYNQALRESGLGTGGSVQQGIQAAAAAVQGLAGGDIKAAIAGGAAPYLAEVIGHQSGLSDGGKVIAHAVVNAALAKAQGNSAVAGAAGAAAGELAGMLAAEIYHRPVSELKEEEKQTVSALATVAAGLAGGLAGGSTSGAFAGAQAGKVTVDFNWLNASEKSALEAARAKLNSQDPAEKAKAQAEEKRLVALSVERDKDVISACSGSGAGSEACGQKRADAALALMGYGEGPYNSKYKDAYRDEYLHIQGILDVTSAKTQDQLAIRDAVAHSLAKSDNLSLEDAYKKFDRYSAARDVIGIIGGTVGAAGLDKWLPKQGAVKQPMPEEKAKSEKPANADKSTNYKDEPPFNPAGTAGAGQPWTTKGRVNYVQLPNKGKIRYIPPEDYSPSQPLPRGPNNGYIDKFKNEWVKGPSRTAGQEFEWDVQLSRTGKSQLGWATRDGSHLNVSLDGKITHK